LFPPPPPQPPASPSGTSIPVSQSAAGARAGGSHLIHAGDSEKMEVAREYAKWYIARLKLLEATLADGREFLCCNRFTLADVCIGYALYLGTIVSLDGQPLSARYSARLSAYLARLVNRESFQKAIEIEKEMSLEFRKNSAARDSIAEALQGSRRGNTRSSRL